MPSVCAVVVTHNRQALLRRCLAALAAQTVPPDRVLVVDNASTDGTPAMLEAEYPQIDRLELARNEGSSGGFHEGLRRAHGDGAEWMWLMDDDTIATESALEALLGAAERLESRPVLLSSQVVWSDGRLHPMNFPTLDRRRRHLIVAAVPQRAVPMRSATFVSLLVHRSAIDRHGLPHKPFFLWSDDIEYTSRIVIGGGEAYFVPESVVLHETPAPVDFRAAPPERFYFHVRNTVLIARAPGRPPRDRVLRLYVLVTTCAEYLFKRHSFAALRAIARGLWDGLLTSPGPPPPGGHLDRGDR